MTVQFKSTGVPLFKSTDVVAMDPDCCCGDPPVICCLGNGPIKSVTFSGGTGCPSILNGTFALTRFSDCTWIYDQLFDTSVDSCASGYCYSAVGTGGHINYWHVGRVAITVVTQPSSPIISVLTSISFVLYRNVSGVCGLGDNFPPRGWIGNWERNACSAGDCAPVGFFDPTTGTAPTLCTVAF